MDGGIVPHELGTLNRTGRVRQLAWKTAIKERLCSVGCTVVLNACGIGGQRDPKSSSTRHTPIAGDQENAFQRNFVVAYDTIQTARTRRRAKPA